MYAHIYTCIQYISYTYIYYTPYGHVTRVANTPPTKVSTCAVSIYTSNMSYLHVSNIYCVGQRYRIYRGFASYRSRQQTDTNTFRPKYRPAQSLYINLNIYLKSTYLIHTVCGIMLGCVNKQTLTRLDQCIVLRSVYTYIYHIHRKSSLYLP